MSTERKIAVITDSGSSIKESFPEAKENNVSIIPLEVKFYEDGKWVPYLDSNISAEEFYAKMSSSKKLPQTSGAITGRAQNLYESMSKDDKSILSIHITSKHSVAYESALLASNLVRETNPDIVIEVIDSKVVSIGTWFLAEKAAQLSAEGYPIEDIKKIILEQIPKIEVFTMLETLDNLVKGGRIPQLAGMFGSLMQIKPIVGFVDGQITQLSKSRTTSKAMQEIIHRVEGVNEIITNLAIIHTNNPQGANEIKEQLQKFYPKPIPVYEAGPVLGVHVGVGGVGIALLKK